MNSYQFQNILNVVSALTKQQASILLEALSGKRSSPDIATTLEKHFSKAAKCPHCGSEELYQNLFLTTVMSMLL